MSVHVRTMVEAETTIAFKPTGGNSGVAGSGAVCIDEGGNVGVLEDSVGWRMSGVGTNGRRI